MRQSLLWKLRKYEINTSIRDSLKVERVF